MVAGYIAFPPTGGVGETLLALPDAGLFGQGLQAGLLSFGGAYTALPFLRDGMIGVYDGVTVQSFLDGIALANVIPAPLVIFGTFLGFMADGLSGALLVTLGIFIPAFSFTLLGHKYLERMVDNKNLHGFLDGVAAAVVGLLAVTAVQIAAQTLTGPWGLALCAMALLGFYGWRHKAAVPLVILICGVAGLFLPL
jgi:chromate transporter